jgi:hypothetical protein
MATEMTLTDNEFSLLTSKCPDLDEMAIDLESLRAKCPLDNDLFHPLRAKTNTPVSFSSIGTLDSFAPEIMHMIFDSIDLQTLTNFRRVSKRARPVLDSHPPYKAVIQHCPDALRALLSTQRAASFEARDIYEALCTQSCHGCGEFAPLLDLFSASRYCTDCVANLDATWSIEGRIARRKILGGSKTMMSKLPKLLSLPGRYSERSRLYKKRLTLVRATAAFWIRSGTVPQSPATIPWDDDQHQMVSPDRFIFNSLRFMAVIRIPYLDPRTGILEWGVSCEACRLVPVDESRGSRDSKVLYTASGYLDHFQTCEMSHRGKAEIQQLAASGHGHISPGQIASFYANLVT